MSGSRFPWSLGVVGPLTAAPAVSMQPLVWLREWQVVRGGDQHLYLFGLRPGSSKVRMTTAVQSTDYGARTWTTGSGRRYVADAAPGSYLTPELLTLAAGVHVLSGDFEDVTDAVWEEMLRCRH